MDALTVAVLSLICGVFITARFAFSQERSRERPLYVLGTFFITMVVVVAAVMADIVGDIAPITIGDNHPYRVVEKYQSVRHPEMVVMRLEDADGEIDFYGFDPRQLRDGEELPRVGQCFSLISPGNRWHEYDLIPVTFLCEKVFSERDADGDGS